MDINKRIFEEVENSPDWKEMYITKRGFPTTLIYHHSSEGKLTKEYMTEHRLVQFLAKFDIIASKQRDDGSILFLVQAKRKCGNCDFIKILTAFGGVCKEGYRHKFGGGGNGGAGKEADSYVSFEFGSDCLNHRRNGKYIIPMDRR